MRARELRAWLLRLARVPSRGVRDREFSEEIETHLAMHVEDNLRLGMDADEARRRAILKLGGVEPTRQAYRERSTVPLLEALVQDLRFALRQLRKRPGFAGTAVMVLALGIGASVTIFGFVDAALIKPLPYEKPRELISLFESNQTGPRFHLSYLDYTDWKRMNHVFSSIAMYGHDEFLLSGHEGVQLVGGVMVSDEFFRTLGVRPMLGRDFHDGEELTSASSTVMLSYAAWQKRFNGRPDVLGQTVTLNGVPASVIGVLPREFHFAPTDEAEFWQTVPATGRCAKQRGCHNFYGVGRLKEGVSIAAADAAMKSIAQQLEKQYPETNRNRGANVISLMEMIVGDIRPILLVLLCGAGLLWLIACVNVASLLLVRSESRRREIALRGALGATPLRLMRQFVTEGLVLAAGGSMLGVVGAYAAMQSLTKMIPAERMASMPYLQGIGLHPRVAVFAVVLSAMAGVIFSLTPALRLSFAETREGLSDGGKNAAGTVWRRFGSNLVVVELAIAMVLLVGAGLLGKSFYHLLHVNTGLQPENLAMLQVWGPGSAFARSEQRVALQRGVLDKLSGLPGVRSVALSDDLPVGNGDGLTTVGFVGKPNLGTDNEVNDREVSPDYFSTLQAQLLHGRYFAKTDDATRPRVAIVNRTLADRYFPNEDAVGRQILFEDAKTPLEIVGVVDDIKEGPLDMATHPVVYTTLLQTPESGFFAIVRTSESPQAMLPAMAAAIHGLDAGVATYHPVTMTDRIHNSLPAYLHRSSAWLVGGFAGMALLLGVVGLYGVIAYSVSQRTREIGVRMALGAQRGSVHWMILREAGRLTGTGITIGAIGALAAATLLRGLLFGVRSWDIPTLVAVAVVLGVSALMASYLPARRAASVNPVDALRAE